jgi:hypothetical protein
MLLLLNRTKYPGNIIIIVVTETITELLSRATRVNSFGAAKPTGARRRLRKAAPFFLLLRQREKDLVFKWALLQEGASFSLWYTLLRTLFVIYETALATANILRER